MLNSDQVFAKIEEIGATASKNEKEVLVKASISDDLFKRVCEYAYNPFKTFGMRKIPPAYASGGDRTFDERTWQILDGLVSRSLTGTEAIDVVACELGSLTAHSAELLMRIIRKDLRAGFSESTINKACKGLVPDFPYMRCCLPKDAKLQKWDWADGVVSQEKADGMFANVDHEFDGTVAIRSRQGSEFPIDKFPGIVHDVQNRMKSGTQNHGEVVVVRDGKVLERQIGNGILNSVLSGGDFAPGDKPVFMMWDQIPLDKVVSKGKYDTPYKMRLAGIVRQLKSAPGDSIVLIQTRIVHSLTEAYAHYRELLMRGKEGTVIKSPTAIWKDGTSKEQVKLKLDFVVDLEVTGIVPGRAGTKNEGRAGSLTCQTCDGKLVVDVTVKNEAMRDSVDANPSDWVGRIIAVVANDILEPSESNPLHSLFLPRMAEACYRTDKTVADSLERVFEQKEAAIFGAAVLKEAA